MILADKVFSGSTNWETNSGFVISIICSDATYCIPDKQTYQRVFVLTWTVAVLFLIQGSVARWQNLISSFPLIVPGWRAIQEKEGIKFCNVE